MLCEQPCLEKLHHEQEQKAPFKVFRGQGLSMENFEKMKKTKGGLMSFNNFLSTSRDPEISRMFASSNVTAPDSVGILFEMTIDPKLCTTSGTPFVNVGDEGYYQDREAEILFTTHTIFRIEQMEPMHDDHTARLWHVKLSFTGNNDNELSTLTAHLRKEITGGTGWSQLGCILIKLGEPAKAEHLYKILLETASSDKDRATYYNQLGTVYKNIGEYSKALSSYEQSLEIGKIVHPPNHPDVATSYNNIGEVYHYIGEYSKALANYERSLEIREIALPPNYLDMAESYNNIGSVYHSMGECSKALSNYKRSLKIYKIALPRNHPELATSYNNIGSVYYSMGECPKALSYFERAQKIWEKSLPANHQNIAAVKTNIEFVQKKLSFYFDR
ncbi:unnamed protein product [Rotaria magnacalcarata]|uniref:Uncharacterized protein n=1 Tax=Rotaria magnacalcarata TaxID=392030 RepID=A0A815GRU8_9BILA|nr:unnamed protein product [Rotaria magnacalcarata]CAF4136531.1 unnamed protein product [Rotaria magnacalcarata]